MEDVLAYIGGENHLPEHTALLVKGLHEVYTHDFVIGNTVVVILPLVVCPDHHCLHVLSCNPSGASDQADSLGFNQRQNWSLLCDEGTTHLLVTRQDEKFQSYQKLCLEVTRLWESDEDEGFRGQNGADDHRKLAGWGRAGSSKRPAPRRNTVKQLQDAIDDHIGLTVGRFTAPPLLRRGNAAHWIPGLQYFPPVMHNNYHCTRMTAALVLPIVPADHELLGKFYSWYHGLESITARGQISASFKRVRQLCSAMPSTVEGAILASNALETRIFSYIPRLATYISKHNYASSLSSSKSRFRFWTFHTLWWILIGTLSSASGGRPQKRRENRNHTETTYAHDGAHQFRGEEMLEMSPRLLLEEDGERTFALSSEYADAGPFRDRCFRVAIVVWCHDTAHLQPMSCEHTHNW
jgi:hypothetical protein